MAFCSLWRNIAFFRLLAACLLCALALPLRADEHLSITLTSADYPPLIDLSLPYGGMLTRIVVEAFRHSDVEVHFQRVPNNRAITGVMNGSYEGSYGWAHAPERDAKLLYSDKPIYINRNVFLQLRGKHYAWKTLADLAPYRIGATLGNHYSDEFSRLQAAGRLQVKEAASDAVNLKKLLLGRIDLFPMEQEAGPFIVAHQLTPAEQGRIEFQAAPFSTTPVFLVIRRSLPQAHELMERFDRGFRQLSESGQLQHLIDDTRQAAMAQSPH